MQVNFLTLNKDTHSETESKDSMQTDSIFPSERSHPPVLHQVYAPLTRLGFYTIWPNINTE